MSNIFFKSTFNISIVSLLVVAIFSLANSCEARPTFGVNTRASDYVIAKLDEFLEQNKDNSGLTAQDLKNAIEESDKRCPLAQKRIQKLLPVTSCALYLLNPLEQLLNEGKDSEAIKRLEQSWILLRPHCHKIGSFYARGRYNHDLVIALVKVEKSMEFGQYKHLMTSARSEYQENLERFNTMELVHENFGEMRWILTYLNDDYTKILAKSAFPKIDNVTDDLGLSCFRTSFTHAMLHWGYKVKEDGSGIKYDFETMLNEEVNFKQNE